MAVCGPSADDGEPCCDGRAEAGEGRSRRRQRRCRRSSGPSGPPPPPLCSSEGGSSSEELSENGEVQVPSRVLARTARLLDIEDDLRRALIITCIGICGDVPVEDVSGLLARRFDLVAEDLVFSVSPRPSSYSSFQMRLLPFGSTIVASQWSLQRSAFTSLDGRDSTVLPAPLYHKLSTSSSKESRLTPRVWIQRPCS
ncbi:hypothetical protein U9M48_009113 [Paspalum notatum var. saurae]|uniref:Uncharacterized protein n=1 Tax=Paspalum notatum var. saurae TaxID=547442 RepID=A0AAQ3SQS2_PASNO